MLLKGQLLFSRKHSTIFISRHYFHR